MVGNTRFRFRAISDSQACDLLRIENRGDTASVVAHVKQKIQVQVRRAGVLCRCNGKKRATFAGYLDSSVG